MTTAPPPITLNESTHRFEQVVDGLTAYVEFQRLPGAIACTHTIVPEALGGRGIGTGLARHVLDHAARRGLKVRPDCSFIHAYIDRHPGYQSISLAHGATLETP
ncbi:MAG TPA: GNAT family N-acetyltransferase [Ottowia sp.]|uniref:GNAT family N-acetyltransferase n=1 Tax=Ottowia sp. TaxID=1898956 RepID=UPI002B8F3554|nr:GNAT family N-acetyltransferase [Ottowia sp.]HMN20362.1 GNAT family N-acetyltransferase [Ottowia sp.]